MPVSILCYSLWALLKPRLFFYRNAKFLLLLIPWSYSIEQTRYHVSIIKQKFCEPSLHFPIDQPSIFNHHEFEIRLPSTKRYVISHRYIRYNQHCHWTLKKFLPAWQKQFSKVLLEKSSPKLVQCHHLRRTQIPPCRCRQLTPEILTHWAPAVFRISRTS